jgi:hypothetical protein
MLRNSQSDSYKIGVGENEVEVSLVVRIESNWTGSSLRARPEWEAILIEVVFGEDTKEVSDHEVEEVVELVSCQLNAGFEGVILLHLDELQNSLESVDNSGRSRVLSELPYKHLRIFKI